MRIKQVVLAITLASAAPLALAQVYIGANAGSTSWSVDCAGTTSCDKSGTGYKVYGGYMFAPAFGAEALYMDLGKTTASGFVGGLGTVNAEIKGSGYGLALVLAGRSNAFSYGGRLGVMSVEAKTTGRVGTLSASMSKTSTQAIAGIYVGYEVLPNLDLRVEFDSTRAKASDGDGGDGNVRLFSGGIAYRF